MVNPNTDEPIVKENGEMSSELSENQTEQVEEVDNSSDKKTKKKHAKNHDPGINKKLVLKPEKTKKGKHKKEEIKDEVPPIDEKLILEEDTPKLKKPRKVRVKKYEESKDKATKLMKNRVKFTKSFFSKIKSKAKGQIDVLVENDYFEAVKRAKILLGISEKDYHQQILITVPDSFSNKDDVKYHLEVKKEGENKLYFDQAYVTILFYGLKSLFIYQANIDHRSGFIAHDRAEEFNYKDIVSIETSLKYDNDDHPKYSVLNAELVLSNHATFILHLRNQRLDNQIAGQPLLSDKEQQVLQLLKDRIRASKV